MGQLKFDLPDPGVHFQPRELAKLCYEAGWTDAQHLLEAVSIIIAESNGYEKRRGPVNPDGTIGNPDGSIDRGLWQINSKAHPDISDADCDNAIKATQFARKLYLANRWGSWSSFANMQYRGAKAMGYAAPGIGNFLLVKNGLPL